MNRLGWSLVCALALVACDGGDNGTDDAGSSAHDSGGSTQDSGAAVTQPVLMAASGDELVEPDLSCLGTRTAPAAGAAADFTLLSIKRGLEDVSQPDTTVQVFAANTIPSDTSCGAGCVEVTTGSDATAMVSLPADGWFAYRVLGDGTQTSTTAQVNVPAVANADGNIEVSVVAKSLFETALTIGNVSLQESTAAFTGTVRDCAGQPLVGAEIRVFGPAGEYPGEMRPEGVRYVYWSDMSQVPVSTQQFTSIQGRYAGANLPPDGTLRLEVWGVRTEGSDPELIACENFPGNADHITILDVEPLRADGPDGCGTGG